MENSVREVSVRIRRLPDDVEDEVTIRAADLPELPELIVGKGYETPLRDAIGKMEGTGLPQHVAIDLYRHLVLGNFALLDGVRGKAAEEALDVHYPSQGALPDFERSADEAAVMVLRNLLERQSDDRPEYDVLGWLFVELLERGVFEQPSLRGGSARQRSRISGAGFEYEDAVAAKRFIERLVPDEANRRAALAALADTIDSIVRAKALAWNVSVRKQPSALHVNVGRYFVFGIYSDKVVVVLDEDGTPPGVVERLTPVLSGDSYFKSLARARSIALAFEEVPRLIPVLASAHARLIERAGRPTRKPYSWDNHYGGVTAYMRELLGRDVADPVSARPSSGYALEEASEVGIAPERLADITKLFEEFLANYPPSQTGAAHIALYTEARAVAAANFAATVAQADAGEDVTDRVLRTLLPHANTPGNRERGAWIHVAPAINKDVRTFFEGAGWTQPEEWPTVASELLSFVRRCVDDPDQLPEACADFVRKGFQVGMVTPILNALRPDAYLVINVKSLALINYLGGTRFGPALVKYPAGNAAEFAIIREIAPLLDQEGRPADISNADLFDMFGHWLYAIRKFYWSSGAAEARVLQGSELDEAAILDASGATDEPRYWKIAPGANAWQWPECRANGFIAVGWDALGDLSTMSIDEFEAAFEAAHAEHPDYTRVGVQQAWQFKAIRIGDRIVANRGLSEVLGVGTVVGSYAFVEGVRQMHRLGVRWDDTTTRRYNAGRSWQRTLMKLSAEQFHAICTAPPLIGSVELIPDVESEVVSELDEETAIAVYAEYPIAELAADTGFDLGELERWVRAIHRKGQAILYGPPGTGKTFVAEGLAHHLVGGGTGIIDTVQFHPAYAYEDFMVGMRPRAVVGGGLEYPLVDGRFVEFCERARRRDGLSVLIVDEINRANLARVFGELMLLLEYREKSIHLAGGRMFSIPPNVRLIGTMNTADRSIALVDHALRRRFAFLGLYPNYDVLRKRHAQTGFAVEALIRVLTRLNTAIGDPHYEVGIAFFLAADLEETIEDVWRMEVEPYIEEYFFDKRKVFEEFRWQSVRAQLAGRSEML